jgi:hypothetical protein
MSDYKEVYIIPDIDEEVLEPSELLVNAATGDQMLHAIVPLSYSTKGTLLWETGMDEGLVPDSDPPHRFAGWRT